MNKKTRLMDVELAALAGTEAELRSQGAAVLSVPTDVAKHGVVTLSETLYFELAQRGTQVGVSVLCPSFVKTNIMTSERNRPAELQNAPSAAIVASPTEQQFLEFRKIVESGMAVEQVADAVFAAVAAKQLYILTHPEFNDAITARAANIVLQRNPVVG